MTTTVRWTREGDRATAGTVQHHDTLTITYDDQDYARVHMDHLGPILRAAGYDPERNYPTDPVTENQQPECLTNECHGNLGHAEECPVPF